MTRKLLIALVALLPTLAHADGNRIDDTKINKALFHYSSSTDPGITAYDAVQIINLYASNCVELIPSAKSPFINGLYTTVPDTLWLKPRPNKNPKEGKHYILTNVYKGALQPESSKKELLIATPADSLRHTKFTLVGASKIGKDSLLIELLDGKKEVNLRLSANHPAISGFTRCDAKEAFSPIVYVVRNNEAKGSMQKVMTVDSVINKVTLSSHPANRTKLNARSSIEFHLRGTDGSKMIINKPQYYQKSSSDGYLDPLAPEVMIGRTKSSEELHICSPEEFEEMYRPYVTTLLELNTYVVRDRKYAKYDSSITPFRAVTKPWAKAGITFQRQMSNDNRMYSSIPNSLPLPSADTVTVAGALPGGCILGVMHGAPVFMWANDLALTPQQRQTLEAMLHIPMSQSTDFTTKMMYDNPLPDYIYTSEAQKNMPLLVAIAGPSGDINKLAQFYGDTETDFWKKPDLCVFSIINDQKPIKKIVFDVSCIDSDGNLIAVPIYGGTRATLTALKDNASGENALSWAYFADPWKGKSGADRKININSVTVHYSNGTTKSYPQPQAITLTDNAEAGLTNTVSILALWELLQSHISANYSK